MPAAVRACARAGVAVRVVTGDAPGTAVAVARRCGILPAAGPPPDGALLTGAEFRARAVAPAGGGPAAAAAAAAEMERAWPALRVLARSSPLDKLALVAGIQA